MACCLDQDCDDGLVCNAWRGCTAPCGGTGIETRQCDSNECTSERPCQGPPCDGKLC